MKRWAKVTHDGTNFHVVLYDGDNIADIVDAPELPVKVIREWTKK